MRAFWLSLAALLFGLQAFTAASADRFHTIRHHVPPPTVSSTTYLYDTAIGNGVDSNGFADLPLKAGSHRYFVSSATGSDANTCTAAQSPSTPKASAASVLACTTDGSGDQILFAEGTTYATAPPSMAGRVGGFSYLYPFVAAQSYDPTDPLNEAKYGRASGTGSHARPVFSGTLVWNGGTGQSYIALRGIDINPGNVADAFNDLEDIGSGFLFENDLFRYSGLILKINHRPIVGRHWIVRNSAFYGEWGAGGINGLYVSGGWGLTVEDSVFYHNGWKIGGLGRNDATQGASVFVHPIYAQHTTKALYRRLFLADGSADCGSHRDDTILHSNVYLYCPIAISAGGGNHADFASPWGDALDVTANAILNGIDLNSSNPRGWGIDTLRGKTIATSRYNVLAHNGGTGQNSTYSVDSLYAAPSYMVFDHNISSQWSASGGTYVARDNSATDFPTFTNNVWDDPTSGTNTNRSSVTFPNAALDAPALATAAGYASYSAMMQYAIDNPEAHIQRSLLTSILGAYGQATPPLIDLAIDSTPWRTGNVDFGPIVGTQPESTLTFGGTWPTGLTFDAKTRFWSLDGTQTAGSGTGTITETPSGGGTPHTTNVSWTVSAAPQLTAFSVTVTGATTATINVTTDTGNGTLYWVVSDVTYLDCDGSSYCPPRLPGEVKNGRDFNDINNTTPFPKQGTQAVASAGAKTISVTGLTAGVKYYAYVMQVSGAGVWSPTTNGLHALGSAQFIPN